MGTENIELKTFLLAAAAVVFIESGSISLLACKNIGPTIATGITRLVETALIILIVIARGNGLNSIGLDKKAAWKGFAGGLRWSFYFGLAVGIIFFILYFTGVNPLSLVNSSLPEKNSELILLFFIGCIIGPAAEELFFRGIVYGFCRRWGIPAAVIISSLLFIFAHQGTQTISATHIIGGVIFAISYEVEKSLITPLTIHILGNMAIYSLPLINSL